MTAYNESGDATEFNPSSGNALIDPFIVGGFKWGTGGLGVSAHVTYSFPTSGASWIGDYYDGEPFNGFQPFTIYQKDAARQALAAWAEVANITFEEVDDVQGDTDVGDIRFANSAAVTNSPAVAWAYFPFSSPDFEFPEAGDVWFDPAYQPNMQLLPSQFGYATMLHEIGHAIGLDHPFVDVTGEPALPANLDTDQYTVMSYTAELSTLAYASSPQLLDILAIQHIYGANMTTRTGNDVYQFSATTQTNQTIWDAGGIDTLDFSNQTTSVYVDLAEGGYSRFAYQGMTSSLLGIAYGVTIENVICSTRGGVVYGNDVANHIMGGNGEETVHAAGGDDFIQLGGSNDWAYGEAGNDTLDGGLGADQLRGGAGNDIYVIDNAGDVINEEGNADTGDRVQASISVNLATLGGGAIEHVIMVGTAALTATGNAAGNLLAGNDAANVLDGGLGADYLIGGGGNDTFVVENLGDEVVETLSGTAGGIDLVRSSFSFSLASRVNIENLTLTGIGAIDATGNALNNVLTGNEAANRLDGGAGNDTLIGGLGGDTYVVDSAGDVVSETIAAGGGIDTVESAVTFSLATRANIENLKLTGAATNGVGNGLANSILGNALANSLDGGAGADVLKGGVGNDVYYLDNAGDVVDEEGNTDIGDEVRTSFALASGFAGIEKYTYTGAAAWNFTSTGENDTIIGGSGNDVLDGASGNDALQGNNGNDTLIGGIGDDWLDGGAGNDKLKGGSGNDTYVVSEVGDTVDEEGNTDIADLVRATISVKLTTIGGGAIEHVLLLGADAINATGNGLANTLTGNDAANTLDGAGGADILTGGKGNDAYLVDDVGDQVVEDTAGAAGGVDTVQSSIGFSLAALANIENLTLTGSSAIDGTGNSGNNVLTGNNAANRLDGGAGNDTMTGGEGGDTYEVDSAGDVVSETIAAGGGIDTVESGVSFSLAALANIENLKLTGAAANGVGNGLANTILGNALANSLDGATGADVLKGGSGNDVYYLDNAGDVVDEEGNTDIGDEVRTSFALASGFAGIESYTYTGSAAWSFTGTSANESIAGGIGNDTLDGASGNDTLQGNNGNDTLIGGIGDDWLDGGSGNDKMKGGSGNDTYVIDSAGDTIDEEGNTDTADVILAFASINLASTGSAGIENVILMGSDAINATGDALDNTLTGNDAANVLDGAGGADILTGGKGNDTYFVDNPGDQVIENANGGVDLVKSSVSLSLAMLANVENLTLTGAGNVNATGNGAANILTGNEGNNILDGGAGNDELIGGKGDDTYVIDSTKDVTVEVSNNLGGGNDTVVTSIFYSLGDNEFIENLTYTGNVGYQVLGNALNNTLTGNDGDNNIVGYGGEDRLVGNDGSDTLQGVDGNDYIDGGRGSDRIYTGAGRDTVDYNHLNEYDDAIYDFSLGKNGDILDLSDLLDSIGYVGSNPFSDGYLIFHNWGSSNTNISVDADGSGGGAAVTMVTLLFTTLTQADTDNYII